MESYVGEEGRREGCRDGSRGRTTYKYMCMSVVHVSSLALHVHNVHVHVHV